MGIRTKTCKQPFDFQLRDNWAIIYYLLKKITKNGYGLFLVEPNFKQSEEGKRFIEKLSEQGFYLNAIFNLPENIFPMTSIKPMLVLISYNYTPNLFIAEINEKSEVQEIVNNFKQKNNTKTLESGQFVDSNIFETFDNFKIVQQIQKLSSQYKEYKRYKLKDVSISINITRLQFEDEKNSLYIPTIGKSEPQDSIQSLSLKHQNYFQLILDEKVVINSYLKIFFNSDLGKLVLESIKAGSIISKINRGSIELIDVPIPSLRVQKSIIVTYHDLIKLEGQIKKLKDELSLNPSNSNSINEKISGALNSFDLLTEADKILSLIRQGESKTLEFKETFSKDVKSNTKEKYIEDASLKNINAFLNTEGGILLIGVSDIGVITGIEKDVYSTDDKYYLHFKDAIKNRIGEELYSLIDYQIIVVGDKKVFIVNCQKSDKPVYLDDKDFFVRSTPATDKLEGPKLVEYINRHFKQND